MPLQLGKVPIVQRKPRKKLTKKRKENQSEKEPKEKKAKVEFNQIPYGFGFLSQDPLEKHDVPSKFVRIENGKDISSLQELQKMVKDATTDPKRYTEACRAFLYLEQAAEALNLERYNQKAIQLSYSKTGTLFQIKKSVSYSAYRIF